MQDCITEELHRIINEGWTDGVSLVWGNPSSIKTINVGNKSGTSPTPISDETMFDLASVTKIFTLIVTLRLVEKGVLSLDAKVGDYTSVFPNIGHLCIFELMNFSKKITTSARIDSFTNPSDARASLYDIVCYDEPGRYSDMGAIVLGMVIDSLPGISLKTAIEEVFALCQLESTYWWTDIPLTKKGLIQSYTNEYMLINNKYITENHPIGVPHDKKAGILGIAGHAGIFSTPRDIGLFASSILSHRVISDESLTILCNSNYDYYTEDGQHYGLLCYKKASNPKQSEVPSHFSNKAFAISGYTGTYLLIDPALNLFISINANRIFNRCPVAEDTKISVKGTRNYVYRKDSILSLLQQPYNYLDGGIIYDN